MDEPMEPIEGVFPWETVSGSARTHGLAGYDSSVPEPVKASVPCSGHSVRAGRRSLAHESGMVEVDRCPDCGCVRSESNVRGRRVARAITAPKDAGTVTVCVECMSWVQGGLAWRGGRAR